MDEEFLANLKDFIAAAITFKGVETFLGDLFLWVLAAVCILCIFNMSRKVYKWYKHRHDKPVTKS